MKKLNRILLTATALFAFFPTLFAQGLNGNPHGGIGADGNPRSYRETEDKVAYSKDITGPENGNYTIHLHSFALGTGSISTNTLPSDVVLVLDLSGSMKEDYTPYTYTERSKTAYTYNNWPNQPSQRYYKHTDGLYHQVSLSHNSYWGGSLLSFTDYAGRTWYLIGEEATRTQPSRVADGQTIWTGVLYTRTAGSSQMKLTALKNAVEVFIKQMEDNNPTTDGVGNQISIVKFADDRFCDKNGNEVSYNAGCLDPTETGDHMYQNGAWNNTEVVKGFTPVSTGAADLRAAMSGLNYGGATAADYGMAKALALIKTLYKEDGITPKRQSNKTVVFFTDGEPNHYSGFDTDVADDAIDFAKSIKEYTAYTDEKHQEVKVSIYSVSIFTSPSAKPVKYINYLSSNYPTAESMSSSEASGTMGGKYYMDASSGNLEDIFRALANESSGNTSFNESSISTVDIVSQSFNIPAGENNIVFYEAPVKSVAEDGTVTFKPKNEWTLKPDGVDVHIDPNDPHKVVATNFDYGKNYCGLREIIQNGIVIGTEPHGSKLVIEIQITMADNAVGGPLTDTNGPQSGIYVNGENKLPFDSPKVDLPVNLQIKKVNMQFGESSKFKIQRSLAKVDENTYNPKPSASTTWDDVTSVFVTKTSKTEEPDVYIRGLNPNYYYRILEENWGWSYDFVSASGPAYVPDVDDEDEDGDTEELVKGTKIITNKNEVTADKFIGNPIVFDNTKKYNIESNVHHAESKAKNIFRTATESNPNIEYVDSKKGNGTGRITP